MGQLTGALALGWGFSTPHSFSSSHGSQEPEIQLWQAASGTARRTGISSL